jgi:hypothetical protein
MAPPEDLDDAAAPLSAEGEPAYSSAAEGARAGWAGKAVAGALWVVLVVAVAGVVGGGVVWREDVVRLWPPARTVYQAVGLDIVPAGNGLAFRNIIWKAVRRNGITILNVRGEVSNISDSVREVPRMRGHLLDDKDRELQRWTFSASEHRLLPGENISFVTELENPATATTRLVIVWDDGRS